MDISLMGITFIFFLIFLFFLKHYLIFIIVFSLILIFIYLHIEILFNSSYFSYLGTNLYILYKIYYILILIWLCYIITDYFQILLEFHNF